MQIGLFPDKSVEKIGVKSFTRITLSLNSFLDIYDFGLYTETQDRQNWQESAFWEKFPDNCGKTSVKTIHSNHSMAPFPR